MMTFEEAQALIDRGPYARWLGLKLLAFGEDGIEVKATWREEWIANPALQQTHGGILAALIDFGSDFALVPKLGRLFPTIDMRVDYHRLAKPGDLTVRARVVKLGRQFSLCEAEVRDAAGESIASGRATFVTAPPPEKK
jgi:uncharacterized protein (TIGR00369 family)